MYNHTGPTIHIAFRFHVNFYHSYRGDLPDETGFGKDIRIIRGILKDLESFNEHGIPVRGTWDIDNFFSLETIIPTYCPDLIDAWQRRVSADIDEINIMSYNNGIVTAHTRSEFIEMFRLTMSNNAGSGLKDLFETVRPIVRPQEMMFTPAHIGLYKECGVEAVSLFYSGVPFNAFSNFIPTLPFAERFNPLTLTYAGMSETITLLPAYNHGDIGENISLKNWLLRIHRQYGSQLKNNDNLPKELLLLIDLDADDDFWAGVRIPVVYSMLSTARGFAGVVESIKDLPFVQFTTPWSYLESHKPVGAVEIRQDTADGGFDGYSSWAEKLSNHRLWTGIEKSRLLENRARRLAAKCRAATRKEVDAHLTKSLCARIKAMSTTHFGLSMPVMNVHRLQSGRRLVDEAIDHSTNAFEFAKSKTKTRADGANGKRFCIIDCRGGSSQSAAANTARYLARVKLDPLMLQQAASLKTDSGESVPFGIRMRKGIPLVPEKNSTDHRRFDTADDDENAPLAELIFLREIDPGAAIRLELSGASTGHTQVKYAATAKENALGNGLVELLFDAQGNPLQFLHNAKPCTADYPLRVSVSYGSRRYAVNEWREEENATIGEGIAVIKSFSGQTAIPGAAPLRVKREYTIAAGLPYLYVTTVIHYPETREKFVSKAKARKLGRRYDRRWKEVMPNEIELPSLDTGNCYRIWKHNFLNHTSSYDLDYHRFSKNSELSSFNNHITHAWIAVSDRKRGLLVAQSTSGSCCFAFCPMRTKMTRNRQKLFLNPFGTYYGAQMKYQTGHFKIGKAATLLLAEQLTSAAPSYAGGSETHSMMIAPYSGDKPPRQTTVDALTFCEPPAVIDG